MGPTASLSQLPNPISQASAMLSSRSATAPADVRGRGSVSRWQLTPFWGEEVKGNSRISFFYSLENNCDSETLKPVGNQLKVEDRQRPPQN